ncbi:MAG: alpha/beta hydrolase [Chitinophagales bacterium]|nr:alpha/beta hydrolase [Chitinophagales bacterium]
MSNLNVKHEYIEVNGIKLHVAKQGNGKKLVVLLHGWPEFWYTWRYQIPELAKHFTVYAPDLRGFNLSDKPHGVANYKTDTVASDIAALVQQSGFKKAFIVGHDWGGAVAWTFATMFPELTEKLVVCNCPHPKLMLDSFKSNPSQLIKSWYIFMHQIPLLPEMIYQFTLPLFFKQFVRGWMYNKHNFSDDDLNEFVKAFKHEGALTGSINYYRAMLQTKPNLKIFDKKIQSPTLLIWGEGDKALGKELTYNTEKYIDAAYEVKYIPNCSHWTQNDCPELVNEFLLDFFITKK